MKRAILNIAALGAVLCANAYTPAETNEVLRTLGIMIELERGPDCFDENGMAEPMPEPYQHYEDLFTNYPTNEVGSSWTAQERQEAFESFLWRLPELSLDEVDKDVMFYAHNLLDFCDWHNRTNILPHVKRILLSPYADELPAARDMFEKFARPSEETCRYMECVMTNRPNGIMSRDQEWIFGSFVNILRKNRNEMDRSVLSNGVRLAHCFIEGQGHRGNNMVDLLMRDLFPDYAMSSNRLVFATAAIDSQRVEGRQSNCDMISFFTPITNALLNASEPLKVLDLSWLDEPMTSGNSGNGNETEQQEENND